MLTTKQIEFCKHVANGTTAAAAYKIAFKSKSSGNCRVNGCKLLKRAEIKAKVAEFQEINKKIVDRGHEIAAQKIAAGEIADKAERMAHLTRIMRGQEKVRSDKFFYDGKTGEVIVQEVYELPDSQAQIRAIAELNKMDGAYAAEKLDITSNGKALPSWAKGE